MDLNWSKANGVFLGPKVRVMVIPKIKMCHVKRLKHNRLHFAHWFDRFESRIVHVSGGAITLCGVEKLDD